MESCDVTLYCAMCSGALLDVDAPQGHEDHRHVRCARCSAELGMPKHWSVCVRLKVGVTGQTAPANTDQN